MDSEQIIDEALKWSQNPAIDPLDREEIKTLIEKDEIQELTERFYKDLEFGTGGLEQYLEMVKTELTNTQYEKLLKP